MRTLIWFILRRFLSSIEIPSFDPKGYVKDRIFTYIFSLIRPGDWMYLIMSVLFGAIIAIEIVALIVSIVHDVYVAVSHDLNAQQYHTWVTLTLPTGVLWVLSLLLWAFGVVTRVFSVIQRFSGQILPNRGHRFSRYNFHSMSWALIVAALIVHVGTYVM